MLRTLFLYEPREIDTLLGSFIVNLRINETLQTGAVGNRTYRVGLNVSQERLIHYSSLNASAGCILPTRHAG